MASKFIQIDFGAPVDFSKFTFSAPKKNASLQGSSVLIQYDGRTPLLELPAFYTFAPSLHEGAVIPKLTAKMPGDKYKTKETDQFLLNVQEFSNILVEEAVKQGRGAWVPARVQKLTTESVLAVMNPLVKVPEDPSKSALFNCKFDGWQSIATEIFDADMNLITIDESRPIESILPMGTVSKMKVVPKIWINPNSFGVTFSIKKLKKEPITGGLPKGVWDIEGSSEGRSEAKRSMAAEAPQPVVSNLEVVDSDEDEPVLQDPDAEYTEQPPMKSRKKVKKNF